MNRSCIFSHCHHHVTFDIFLLPPFLLDACFHLTHPLPATIKVSSCFWSRTMKVLLLSSTLLSGGLASIATTTAGSSTSTSSIDEQIRRSLTKKALVLDELPNSNGGQWQTLPNGVEYQPAPDLSPLAQEHLRRLTTSDTTSRDAEAYQKMFVDGAETYYDEYSQAWRALGFYIDCDADQMLQDDDEPRRKLPEEDEDQGPCHRYLLWAAVSRGRMLRLVFLVVAE